MSGFVFCTALPIDWNAVSAIATAGAAGVALWFGSAQTRAARQLERTRANLVASSITPQLHTLHTCLTMVDMQVALPNGSRHVSGREMDEIFRIVETPTISTEELVALAYLGNKCGNRLARCLALVDELRRHIATYSASEMPLPADVHEIWLKRIGEARSLLKAVALQCADASREHAPMPSGQELYGASALRD